MPPSELLSPAAAARARQLEFFARTRVEGFMRADNRSKLKGRSTDFLQHRAYQPGDDLRALDWRVLARSDRLVTRQYEEYTNLDVILGLDYSGSMGYGGETSGEEGGLSKIQFVRHCAAMLTYLLNLQKDRFGLAVMADRVVDLLVPSTGRKHLARVLNRLMAHLPAGQTDLAPCVDRLARRVRRKSVFVFFSDCYQDPESLTRAIGTLRLAGHDAVLYHVYDPGEQDLAFSGFTLFRDLETGQIDAVDPPAVREAYRDVFRDHVHRLGQGTRRFGIEFHSLATSPDWDVVLAELLHARAARS